MYQNNVDPKARDSEAGAHSWKQDNIKTRQINNQFNQVEQVKINMFKADRIKFLTHMIFMAISQKMHNTFIVL